MSAGKADENFTGRYDTLKNRNLIISDSTRPL